jgi:hypothetical protein
MQINTASIPNAATSLRLRIWAPSSPEPNRRKLRQLQFARSVANRRNCHIATASPASPSSIQGSTAHLVTINACQPANTGPTAKKGIP